VKHTEFVARNLVDDLMEEIYKIAPRFVGNENPQAWRYITLAVIAELKARSK
jgi:hypothetical protein